ncbi:MAG: hypothetical protein HYR91_13725, partial [Flavobacteriia bacterium]|nr:hypothetical protein [Flavobacteriia bacterium]
DGNKNIPEITRANNSWKKSQLFNKIEPLKFEFLTGDFATNKTNVFWTPVIAGNFYDKAMFGFSIHNLGVPFKRCQYLIAPLFSTERKTVSGIAEISYSYLPKVNFKLIKLGGSIKSFGNGDNSNFTNVSPYLYLKIGNRKAATPISQNVLLQGSYTYNATNGFYSNNTGGFVKYTFNYTTADHFFSVSVRNDFMQELESKKNVSRASIEGIYSFRYLKNKMKRWVELRMFFGKIYASKTGSDGLNENYQYSLSGAAGKQDIFYEEYYFARNNTFGMWNQQRNENMGGFKSADWYGTTSNWLTAGNLYFQLPIKPNCFGIFADAGAFSKSGVVYGVFNTGIGFRISKVFGIYFPLYQSQNESMLFTNYSSKIRFTLKMNIVNKGLRLKLG